MNFTVYRSSAGSGKTFTLVKEYLKIALTDEADPPQKFRKILAITFTNKAAQEMKDRVIKALKELAAVDTTQVSNLATILIAELGLDRATLAIRSERLLRAILHQYGDFAIGTIDAFTHRIVRNFAYDLGLPINFEIETEKEALVQKAVDKMMSRIGQEAELTETLLRFAEEKADREKSWQIEEELKRTAGILLEENGTLQAEKLHQLSMSDFKRIREQLSKLEKSFENHIESLASATLARIKQAGLLTEHFSNKNAGIIGWFTKITEGDYKDIIEYNKNIAKTLDNNSWVSADGKSQNVSAAINSIAPSIEVDFHTIRNYCIEHYPAYITRSSVMSNIYSLAVLNELDKTMEEFRNEDSIVHISEFNHIISKVVSEQPVPFIFEKLGARYAHFLIDEFQDTSGLQWQNLLPLLENGLAEGNFSMVVGDAKQAIYRWRGGDVEQFIQLPQIQNSTNNPLLADREKSLIRNYKEHPLEKNFRSQRTVIEFNNSLFLSLSKLLTTNYRTVYEQVAQTVKEGNDGGYVEVRFPSRAGKKKAEVTAAYIEETITLIQELIAEGWNANEIALLTRTNQEGSELAAALINAGIEVLSSDSLLIRNSPLIGCLVSLLRALEHPEDKIALADIATYLNKTGKGKYPVHILKTEKHNLTDVLAYFNIKEDLGGLSVFPIYQQCEWLVRMIFPDELKNAWVIFFLDELLKFGTSRSPDRMSFFEWWEDRSKNASVVVTEGTDAVRVMTIHKSKGLEFPVVIMPFLNWTSTRNKGSIWVTLDDPELADLPVGLVSAIEELSNSTIAEQYIAEKNKSILDQMNVLYVGCTRAVHRLYMLSEEDDSNSKDVLHLVKWLSAVFSKELSESNTVSFGEKESPVHHTVQSPEFITLGAGEGKWTGKIRVRKLSEDSWNNEPTDNSRSRGILLHHLLQSITTSEEVNEVVKLALGSGQLLESDAEETRALLSQVVNHPELSAYFQAGNNLRSEQEILIPNSTSSRPDRVVIQGRSATILDYKSGVESEDHVNQIKHYRSLLQRMGYEPVQGKLIYLSPMKVVNV